MIGLNGEGVNLKKQNAMLQLAVTETGAFSDTEAGINVFCGLLSCSQLEGIADVCYEVKETVGGVSVEMLRE